MCAWYAAKWVSVFICAFVYPCECERQEGDGHRLLPYECERQEGDGNHFPPYGCERPGVMGTVFLLMGVRGRKVMGTIFLLMSVRGQRVLLDIFFLSCASHPNFWDKFSRLALELTDRLVLLVSKFWDLPISSLPSCLQCWVYSAATRLFLCVLRIQTQALLFCPSIHLPSLHQLFLLKYGWSHF